MKVAILLSLLLPLFAFGEGGVDGRGGGNSHTQPPRKIGKEELQQIMDDIEVYAAPVFFGLEQSVKAKTFEGDPLEYRVARKQIDSSDREQAAKAKRSVTELRRIDKVLQKVFPESGDDLNSLLRKVSIKVEYDKPCHDHNKQCKDGASFTDVPNQICISAKRLLPKLNEKNVIAEIVALVAHEYAHRKGASEREARYLQKEIKARIREAARLDFWAASGFHKKLGLLQKDYAAMVALLGGGKKIEAGPLCLKLGKMARQLEDLRAQSAFPGKGLAPFSYETGLALAAAGVQAQNLRNFCLEEGDPDRLPFGDLKGELDRSLQLLGRVQAGKLGVAAGEGCDGPIGYLDRDNLLLNFHEFRKNMDEVFASGNPPKN